MATGAAPKKSLFKRRAGPVIAQKTAEPNTPSNATTTSTPTSFPSATTLGMSTMINPFVTGPDSSPPIPAANDPGIDHFRRAKHFFPKTIEASLRAKETQAQTTLPKGAGANSHDLKRRKVSSEQDGEAIVSRSSSPQHDAHNASSQVDLRDSISPPPLSHRDKGKGIAAPHTLNEGITFVNDSNSRKRSSSEVDVKEDPTPADDSVILLDDSDDEDVKPLPQRPRKDSWEEDEDALPKSKGILKGIRERIKASNNNSDDLTEVIDPEFEEYIIRARAQNAANRAARELQEINAQLSASARRSAGDDAGASFDSQATASSAATAVASDSQPRPPSEQSYRIFITSRLPESVPPLIANVRMDQEMNAVKNAFISHAREKGYEMPPEVVETVLLTWKGSKIYDFTTGLSLNLQPDAKGRFPRTSALDNLSSFTEESTNRRHKVSAGFVSGGLHIEIWTEETYRKYVLDQEKQRRRNMGETLEEDLMSDNEDGNTQDTNSTQKVKREGSMANGGNGPQSQPAQDKIRLVLISRDFEKLNVTAHSDTPIGTLIRAFRLQLSIADDKIVTVWMDGEQLEEDSTVGDADMMDMDTVEVHIK